MRRFLKLFAAGIAAFLFIRRWVVFALLGVVSVLAVAQTEEVVYFKDQSSASLAPWPSGCSGASYSSFCMPLTGTSQNVPGTVGHYTHYCDASSGKYSYCKAYYGGSCPTGYTADSSGKCVQQAPPPTACNPPKMWNADHTACVLDPIYPDPGPDGSCASEQTLTEGKCVPDTPKPTPGTSAPEGYVYCGQSSQVVNANNRVQCDSGVASCGGWACTAGPEDMSDESPACGVTEGGAVWCKATPKYTDQPMPPCVTQSCQITVDNQPYEAPKSTEQPPSSSAPPASTVPREGGEGVVCVGGTISGGSCICPAGKVNINGICTAQSSSGGTGTTGAVCGGPGLPDCRVVIAADGTRPELDYLSRSSMGTALDVFPSMISELQRGGLNMHGVAFDWTVGLPSNSCQPWLMEFSGHRVTIDACPVAEKIRSIAEYALYFFTGLTLIWIFFGSGKEA